MVGPLRDIPDEPVDQQLIEAGHIMRQGDPVPIRELLLDRAVEPLDEGVHLGRAGIRMEVRYAELFQLCRKVLGELTPVVGLDAPDTEWRHAEELAEEISGCGRGQ